LDNEARDPNLSRLSNFGKLREPALKMYHAFRALGFKSEIREWMMPARFMDDEPLLVAGQLPMHSPSVFNFYKPLYTPPNTKISQSNLLAPEFQIYNEVSSAEWVNAIEWMIYTGAGRNWSTNPFTWDVKSSFENEQPLADKPEVLVDRLAELLLGRPASQALRGDVISAINLITTNRNDWRKERARIAAFMLLISPEFLVQK
jgi:Protein of unknown function (DUF1800)